MTNKEWRIANPERVIAWKKRYYQKHKEEIKVKTNNYYYQVRKQVIKNNPELFKQKTKIWNDAKYARRKNTINQLRVDLGGKCSRCGYSEEIRILQFHHLRDKIAEVSILQTVTAIKAEALKCILLCPNCHAKEHLT